MDITIRIFNTMAWATPRRCLWLRRPDHHRGLTRRKKSHTVPVWRRERQFWPPLYPKKTTQPSPWPPLHRWSLSRLCWPPLEATWLRDDYIVGSRPDCYAPVSVGPWTGSDHCLPETTRTDDVNRVFVDEVNPLSFSACPTLSISLCKAIASES